MSSRRVGAERRQRVLRSQAKVVSTTKQWRPRPARIPKLASFARQQRVESALQSPFGLLRLRSHRLRARSTAVPTDVRATDERVLSSDRGS